jgi:hypothetical protein
MITLAAAGTFVAGKAAGTGIDSAKKGFLAPIARWRARRELARICGDAMMSAAAAAPSLTRAISSKSFLAEVIVPVVRASLDDPSRITSAEALAERYLEMFVGRYASIVPDEALERVFNTDRQLLVAALRAFLRALKSGLYTSKHWKEQESRRTIEAMSVSLGQLHDLFEGRHQPQPVSLADAKRNAVVASSEMRTWPSDILGHHIETPTLDRILAGIAANPNGTSLLVGEAGSGKSALFARLVPELAGRGITPIAIKADQLPATVETIDDIARALGAPDGMEAWIVALADAGPVALLVDQLDAVSSIMDRHSRRMHLLLRLVRFVTDLRQPGKNIYVLVSSRPFEAAHDARFGQLHAEEIRLDLLEPERVADFLAAIDIRPDSLDQSMLQTLRRPFALKLFAEVAARGAEVDNLVAGELLDRWLATADLGGPDERREATSLMTTLAEEMVATETLWRPADRFDLEFPAAMRRCVACGLILREGERIGFSHQSWLDDFQAKAYAWDRQDSLFVRASILRGLQRLRAQDIPAYEAACRALLTNVRTRRHILHLIADIIATNVAPLPSEIAWLEGWISNDPPLARRALVRIAARWEGWRPAIRPFLPRLMENPDLLWVTSRLLGGEFAIDTGHVVELVERHWADASRDSSVFGILDHSASFDSRLGPRMAEIFARAAIHNASVAHLIDALREKGRTDDAIAVLALWLPAQPVDRHNPPALYGLPELAKAAPTAFVCGVLPWFTEVAGRNVMAPPRSYIEYPRSGAFRSLGISHENEGGVFDAFDLAVDAAAKSDAFALWELLGPLVPIEIDEVQEVVVRGLGAAGESLAREGLAYLLGDPRRLCVSDPIGMERGRVITNAKGWYVRLLIRAIAPYLDVEQLRSLRDAIEAWAVYNPEALAEPDASADRRRWAEEARYALLAELPAGVLDPTRFRQVRDWAALQPDFSLGTEDAVTSSWVEPPMNQEEMAASDDDAILAILDEHHDGAPCRALTWPIERSGGVESVALAFAAFGKANPMRALAIAKLRFVAGRHEQAAGALLRELAREQTADGLAVRDLVLELCERGFDSPEWRIEAARALDQVASRTGGFSDDAISLLLSWIETNPDVVAAQIAERLTFERMNAREEKQGELPHPILFGRGGGMEVLPSHNFTLLSAIASGLFHRTPPGAARWVAILRDHLSNPEDPAIWTALLLWRRWGLFRADPVDVEALLDGVLDAHPAVFADPRAILLLWPLRTMASDRLVIAAIAAGLASKLPRLRQAAAEFAVAAYIVEPGAARYQALFAMVDMNEPATATGVAHALSTTVDKERKLEADALTLEMLEKIGQHDKVLRASLTGNFIEALQGLLLHPGFDEAVLTVVERVTAILQADPVGVGRGLLGREIVHIAIALQRNDGPIRGRAMNLYETLLDAEVYGAEEAARDALGR